MINWLIEKFFLGNTEEVRIVQLWHTMVRSTVLYIFYFIYFYVKPSPYLNHNVVLGMIWACLMFIFISLGMLALQRFFIRSPTRAKHFPLMSCLAFCFINLALIYPFGILSAGAGFILGVSPILGLILFRPRIIYTALSLTLLVSGILCLCFISGCLAYAPIWQTNMFANADTMRFYSNTMMFLGTPYVIVYSLFLYAMINSRRSREKAILLLSQTDMLLNIDNRRTVLHKLQLLIDQASKRAITVVLLDIDHFKQINDMYGHTVGDTVLIAVGKMLQRTIPDEALLGRYGGEEFLIVLPNMMQDEALEITEKCRQAMHELKISIPKNKPKLKITASFGVHSFISSPHVTLKDIIHLADQKMYFAKESGRDCISFG